MGTSNTYNNNPYQGKRAWTVNKGTLKSKVKDIISYAGVFLGVGLVAFSLLDYLTLYYLAIIGVIVSPISLIIRYQATIPKFTMVVVEGEEDHDPYEGWDDVPKVSKLKMFIYYAISTLGVGLTVGGWITLNQGVAHFFTFTFIGLVLSVLSRYNFKKQKKIAIIEDYSIYFLVFAGVTVIAYGIYLLITSPILAVVLILVGSFLTPYVIISRENTLSDIKNPITLRKYFTMLSAVIGISSILVGVFSLLTGSYLTSLLILEGLVFLVGGSIFYGNGGLASLKDIL